MSNTLHSRVIWRQHGVSWTRKAVGYSAPLAFVLVFADHASSDDAFHFIFLVSFLGVITRLLGTGPSLALGAALADVTTPYKKNAWQQSKAFITFMSLVVGLLGGCTAFLCADFLNVVQTVKLGVLIAVPAYVAHQGHLAISLGTHAYKTFERLALIPPLLLTLSLAHPCVRASLVWAIIAGATSYVFAAGMGIFYCRSLFTEQQHQKALPVPLLSWRIVLRAGLKEAERPALIYLALLLCRDTFSKSAWAWFAIGAWLCSAIIQHTARTRSVHVTHTKTKLHHAYSPQELVWTISRACGTFLALSALLASVWPVPWDIVTLIPYGLATCASAPLAYDLSLRGLTTAWKYPALIRFSVASLSHVACHSFMPQYDTPAILLGMGSAAGLLGQFFVWSAMVKPHIKRHYKKG